MSARPTLRRPGLARLAPLIALALLLGAWELYAKAGPLDAFLLPAPSDIAASLGRDRTLLLSDLGVTAREVLGGVALAACGAIALAAAIHFSRALRAGLYPLLVASQTIPIAIVAPLLVVWLGYDLAPKVAIVALACFFPIVVAALDGLRAVEPELLTLARTLDASRWQTFVRIEAPSALPGLFSGVRIAVSVSVIGAVLAEQSGSSEGLGHLILQSVPQLETARAYAAVVLLAGLAVALFAAIGLLERRTIPWARAS